MQQKKTMIKTCEIKKTPRVLLEKEL